VFDCNHLNVILLLSTINKVFASKELNLRIFYTFLYYSLIPLIVLRLLFKSLRNPAYRARLKERFGLFQVPTALSGGLWIHSVSVGETVAAAHLINRLLDIYPDLQITVTTMTPAGSDRVLTLLKGKVFHTYVPYDIPFALNRFLRKVRPIVVIVMETEIWPNLLHCCQGQKIPVILANARLSARSASKYSKLPRFTKALLNQLTLIIAQNTIDAKRYINLGASPDKVTVIGNLKFNQQLPENIHQAAKPLKRMWSKRKVWVVASTHQGEEEIILTAFKKIKQCIPEILLVLVPRHPERFKKVTHLCRAQGYQVQERSDCTQNNSKIDIFIVDTMGELLIFYATADLAFIGGSLVQVGGHNFLEAAALGVAMITGPYVFNFAEISAMLEQAQGLIKIENESTLAKKVIELMTDDEQRITIGRNAMSVVEKNRGEIMKAYLSILNKILSAK